MTVEPFLWRVHFVRIECVEKFQWKQSVIIILQQLLTQLINFDEQVFVIVLGTLIGLIIMRHLLFL